MCMCPNLFVCHVSANTTGGQKRGHCPVVGALGYFVRLPAWVLGAEPWHSARAQVFSAQEPSLRPLAVPNLTVQEKLAVMAYDESQPGPEVMNTTPVGLPDTKPWLSLHSGLQAPVGKSEVRITFLCKGLRSFHKLHSGYMMSMWQAVGAQEMLASLWHDWYSLASSSSLPRNAPPTPRSAITSQPSNPVESWLSL